jgi:transcriptional regulator with XRE-family HTH domain
MNDPNRETRFNVSLGEKIRDRRREAGLVQAQLAQMVGLSRASVTNIEAGMQAPPPYRLALIADALRVHVADLMPMLGEVGEPELPRRFADAFASVTAEADKQAREGTPRGQG